MVEVDPLKLHVYMDNDLSLLYTVHNVSFKTNKSVWEASNTTYLEILHSAYDIMKALEENENLDGSYKKVMLFKKMGVDPFVTIAMMLNTMDPESTIRTRIKKFMIDLKELDTTFTDDAAKESTYELINATIKAIDDSDVSNRSIFHGAWSVLRVMILNNPDVVSLLKK